MRWALRRDAAGVRRVRRASTAGSRIEVDPRLAHETDTTVAEAKALWWLVDRPNLFIKIPATQDGLPAITATLAEGISVNVTLIFSLERYGEVMDAFLAGLEQAKANGHDLTKMGSVGVVLRVPGRHRDRQAAGEDRLRRGQGAARQGRDRQRPAGLRARTPRCSPATAWQALADAGAHPQRPLWASTSTKNPDYRDVIYVEELIAPGIVNTMPEAVIHAFADHGETAARHGDRQLRRRRAR